MKRALIGVVAILVLVGAFYYLRRAPVGTQATSQTAAGLYENDSLGVGMPLPTSPGWSFRYGKGAPGEPVVMAVHAGQKASVRLYAHPKDATTLENVITQRKQQLASIFKARDLDEVIEKVLQDEYVQFQGHPAWHYQGLTEPVAVAGEPPQKVMFMALALEREESIFDIVGILAFPVRPAAQEQEAVQALSNDLQFVFANLMIR